MVEPFDAGQRLLQRNGDQRLDLGRGEAEREVWISTRGGANSGNTSTGMSAAARRRRASAPPPRPTTRKRNRRLVATIQRIMVATAWTLSRLAVSGRRDPGLGAVQLGRADRHDRGAGRRAGRTRTRRRLRSSRRRSARAETCATRAGIGPCLAVARHRSPRRRGSPSARPDPRTSAVWTPRRWAASSDSVSLLEPVVRLLDGGGRFSCSLGRVARGRPSAATTAGEDERRLRSAVHDAPPCGALRMRMVGLDGSPDRLGQRAHSWRRSASRGPERR